VDPEKIRRSAESKMADMAGSELFKGIMHTELVREGEVADVLSDLVRQDHIDLIVLGTEGRTGLRKFLLGSVAEVVFRTAECPVLTLGPHRPHILVAHQARLAASFPKTQAYNPPVNSRNCFEVTRSGWVGIRPIGSDWRSAASKEVLQRRCSRAR